jgi:hypothetical protein
MTRKDALAELIAMVEAGGGISWGYAAGLARTALGDLWHSAMDAYCGSLDAAKALHEAVLPGWRVGQIGHRYAHQDDPSDAWSVWIVAPDYFTTGAQASAKGPCPARAWLLAILRALNAMEGDQP